MNRRHLLIGGIVLVVAVAVGLQWWGNRDASLDQEASTARKPTVQVRMPARLSAEAEAGQALFNQNCAACHGERAGGTNQGPPLIHPIYEPGHHADLSFVLAARNGARAHHWQFGNMPPQPQVSGREVMTIVSYVRALQRANGID